MTAPFLGEIKMVGFNFAPRGFAQCNGQILSISQNTALFSLLGTTYGGNGQTTFALPDLRSRVPLHVGQGPGLSSYALGQVSGTETVTLIAQQLAPHSHTVNASATATSKSPANNFPAVTGAGSSYAATADGTTMNPAMTTGGGGGQPHTNLQPSLCINFVIALEGIFPSRN
jgi:microcystin-dependent protein